MLFLCCVSCVITRLVVALSAASDRKCRHGSGLMPMPQALADNVSQFVTQSDHIAPATIPYFIPYFSISARHRSRKCHRPKRGQSSMAPLSTQSRFLPSRLCRDVCLPLVHLVTLTGSKRTSTSLLSRTSLLNMHHSRSTWSALDTGSLSFRALWIPIRCVYF